MDLSKRFETLEKLLIEDYHKQSLDSNLALFDELEKHIIDDDFMHYYNSLHIYCRFLDNYSFEKEWVKEYVNSKIKVLQ